ncbi:MAG: hypothetical protein N2578_09960, partial [Bdellovibrionaceae bacterium]|nr:hypothetical protein [Pseudobdellovibrionaceae bacterium]
ANPKTTVRPHLPNRGGIGAHVNVDGVALLSNSRHFKSAAEVIHILITPKVQLALSQSTGKHPANASVVNPVLDRVFGPIEENRSFDLNRIGVFKDHAVKIATEAGLK